MRSGILIAAFGSSNPAARESLKRFEDKVRRAFPETPVRWAFTSGFVRRRLADEGAKTDSVKKALEKMRFEGYGRVALLSLLVAPGREYELLREEAAAVSGPDFKVAVSEPLLARVEDAPVVARAVVASLPRGRSGAEPVLLMGHGTWRPGDSRYALLAEALADLDPLLFLATMEGAVTIHDVLPGLRRWRDGMAGGAARVWLAPLLAVAGAHVVRDMAGDEPESWAGVLRSEGFAPQPVMRGAAEREALADVWLDRLRQAAG